MTCKNSSKKCSEDVCYCPQYDFSEVKSRTNREDSYYRTMSKMLNFGLRYGTTPAKLSEFLEVTDEA